VVLPSIRASLTRLFIGEDAEDVRVEAAGVNDLDHKTIPPFPSITSAESY
jgi:hypothetical protein